MKIATFNINNINRRLENLLQWLKAARPDVVALQELKAANSEFPVAAIEKAGYGAVWRGQKPWNGVAILARGATPVLTHNALPGDAADKQARYIAAAVNGVLVTSIYAPNGNPQPGPKFDYKIDWTKRLIAHAKVLFDSGLPVVLAGDYNIVPSERDIYPTTSYAANALVQPESRRLFKRLLDQGWRDAIRAIHPDETVYTFWDYMRNRWPRNAGLRLDHLLLSKPASMRLVDAGVDRDVRGLPNASDHAPAWIVLGDEEKAKRRDRVSRSNAGKGGKAKDPTPGGMRQTQSRTTSSGAAGTAGRRPSKEAPLLVIDGDSFAHRAYHALPKNIRLADGSSGGAILGFANMLLRLHASETPRAVLVAWDTLEAKTYRHKALPVYQSGRVFDRELIAQLKLLPKFVAALGFANAKKAGYEADDFLAAAASAGSRRGGKVLIASGDRDTFQLASENTVILYPVRAGEMARIGPAEVRERYGVDPAQVPDFIAIRGDSSDKIPGAPGVGAAAAASVLRKFGSLEAALKAGRFAPYADELRLYRKIATMDHKAPLPSLRARTPTWAKAAELAKEWGLKQLASRLEQLAQ